MGATGTAGPTPSAPRKEKYEVKTKKEQMRRLVNECFADDGCGYQGRTAVLVAGDVHNFLRRNKPLASLRKQGPDTLRNGF